MSGEVARRKQAAMSSDDCEIASRPCNAKLMFARTQSRGYVNHRSYDRPSGYSARTIASIAIISSVCRSHSESGPVHPMSGRPKGWALPHTSTAPSPSQFPTQQRTTRRAYISHAPRGTLQEGSLGYAEHLSHPDVDRESPSGSGGRVATARASKGRAGRPVVALLIDDCLGRRGPLAGPVGGHASPEASNAKSQDEPKEKSRAAACHSALQSAGYRRRHAERGLRLPALGS